MGADSTRLSLSPSSLKSCIEGIVQLGSPNEKKNKTDEVLGNAFAIVADYSDILSAFM